MFTILFPQKRNDMLYAEELLDFMNEKHRVSHVTGVPCSYFKPMINAAHNSNKLKWVNAFNEGDALSVCSGIWLGGGHSVLLLQNSGLGNLVSPLTSLNNIFDIPVLIFISLRGDLGDAPQHEQMGRITEKLLDSMEVKYEYLNQIQSEAESQISKAFLYMRDNRKPFVLLVKKNTFEPVKLIGNSIDEDYEAEQTPIIYTGIQTDEVLKRTDVLRKITEIRDNDTIIVSTTGHISRDLNSIKDDVRNLYMVGSMGCAASIGLGIALVNLDRKVIIIDGDGSSLMRSSFAMLSANRPIKNIIHIVLDNGSYESTGGQMTASEKFRFDMIAHGFGYNYACSIHDIDSIENFVKIQTGMLSFAHIKIDSKNVAPETRPEKKPRDNASALRHLLKYNTDKKIESKDQIQRFD